MTTPDSTYTPPPPRKRKHRALRVIGFVSLAITALIVLATVLSSGHGSPTHAASSPSASSSPSAAAPSTAPSAPSAAPSTSAPSGTASQQQALTSAQSYLGDGQGFSRLGLIKQLSSPYGDKFSVADATWAVDRSGANWDAQAVLAAKAYMSDGQGFSRSGLIDQLTSAYGDSFTYAQATYAANQAGL
jgi:hypothetical protein